MLTDHAWTKTLSFQREYIAGAVNYCMYDRTFMVVYQSNSAGHLSNGIRVFWDCLVTQLNKGQILYDLLGILLKLKDFEIFQFSIPNRKITT